MLNLWRALWWKYRGSEERDGEEERPARWLELIAAMLFWVIFQNYLETDSRQKAFAHFMGISQAPDE